MRTFENVPPRVDPDTCLACRTKFRRGARVKDIYIVAGVGPNPRGYGECLYVSEMQELIHASCLNSSCNGDFDYLPRTRLIVTTHLEPLTARVPDYICALCKQRFVRNDRVERVMLVEGTLIDPEINAPAVQCSGDYEIVHARCDDPKFERGSS